MGRFINGERRRASLRSRLNNRMSPARFCPTHPTPQCKQTERINDSENANDENQPAREFEPKEKKKPRRKVRRLRRSRRNLVLMKSHPKLERRCRKERILKSPELKSKKPIACKSKNSRKTKK